MFLLSLPRACSCGCMSLRMYVLLKVFSETNTTLQCKYAYPIRMERRSSSITSTSTVALRAVLPTSIEEDSSRESSLGRTKRGGGEGKCREGFHQRCRESNFCRSKIKCIYNVSTAVVARGSGRSRHITHCFSTCHHTYCTYHDTKEKTKGNLALSPKITAQ